MKLSTLHQNEKNPRTISDAALERLAESIQNDPEFMVLRPIVIDEKNMIIGGNQRYRALVEKLKRTDVPASWVVKASKLTKDQKRRFMLIDNAPQGMSGEWDFTLLRDNFTKAELESLGFDPTMLGDLPPINVPMPGQQQEPVLQSEVLVEIRCTKKFLKDITTTLNKWGEQPNVSVDIS